MGGREEEEELEDEELLLLEEEELDERILPFFLATALSTEASVFVAALLRAGRGRGATFTLS